MFRRISTGLTLVAALLLMSGTAQATSVTFSGAAGTRSASATFSTIGASLVVALTNTSVSDVLVPTDVLTGVFFSVAGDPNLASTSAVLASGSTVAFGPAPSGGVVGGEWAYKDGLSGAPRGADEGISSAGLGLFGNPTFPGSNLQGPAAVGGMQYGILSAGDNSATGNAPVTGANAFIKNAVIFTLSGLPPGFDPAAAGAISKVSFQYGTNLSEPNIEGGRVVATVVPEPASIVLMGVGVGLVIRRLRRR